MLPVRSLSGWLVKNSHYYILGEGQANGQLHFATFAKLQSPGFNVTAKYAGSKQAFLSKIYAIT